MAGGSAEKMWALVKEKPKKGLWMRQVPVPEVGPNDVKIKSREKDLLLPLLTPNSYKSC